MRILVVDDDPLAGELTAAVLDDAGYATTLAEGGRSALEILKRDSDFDAVVSDMNMPDISGIELLKSLRALQCKVPFILLSAENSDLLSKQEPELSGCVAKDFNLEQSLPAAVAKALSAS